MSINHHQPVELRQNGSSSLDCEMYQCCSQERGGQSCSHFPMPSKTDASSIWYPDSGATNHITNDISTLNHSIENKGMNQLLMMGNRVLVPSLM